MQFTVASVLALAATVSASYPAYSNSSSVAVPHYTTEVVTAYTTVCPEATTLTVNGVTYPVKASETLVLTQGPYTIVKPVTTSSVVYCNTCPYPTVKPAPVQSAYSNSTTVKPVAPAATSPAAPVYVPANGANQAIAFSGASLAGLLGLAAYLL